MAISSTSTHVKQTFTIPAVCWAGEETETLLSLEEAPGVVFPDADSLERKDIPSDDELRGQMQEILGRAKPSIWEPYYITFVARKQGEVIGYAVIYTAFLKHATPVERVHPLEQT